MQATVVAGCVGACQGGGGLPCPSRSRSPQKSSCWRCEGKCTGLMQCPPLILQTTSTGKQRKGWTWEAEEGVWGVGCGVWGVGCGVWGVGCGVWGVGWVGVGCGVWGVGARCFPDAQAGCRVLRALRCRSLHGRWLDHLTSTDAQWDAKLERDREQQPTHTATPLKLERTHGALGAPGAMCTRAHTGSQASPHTHPGSPPQ
jgi:hypothetical protein